MRKGIVKEDTQIFQSNWAERSERESERDATHSVTHCPTRMSSLSSSPQLLHCQAPASRSPGWYPSLGVSSLGVAHLNDSGTSTVHPIIWPPTPKPSRVENAAARTSRRISVAIARKSATDCYSQATAGGRLKDLRGEGQSLRAVLIPSLPTLGCYSNRVSSLTSLFPSVFNADGGTMDGNTERERFAYCLETGGWDREVPCTR